MKLTLVEDFEALMQGPRRRGGWGAEAPPDYLTVTGKKDCFYL